MFSWPTGTTSLAPRFPHLPILLCVGSRPHGFDKYTAGSISAYVYTHGNITPAAVVSTSSTPNAFPALL